MSQKNATAKNRNGKAPLSFAEFSFSLLDFLTFENALNFFLMFFESFKKLIFVEQICFRKIVFP